MGKRLRILREDQGINQTELAQRMADMGAGIDPSYLSQIEADAKMPRLPVLAAIVRALNTTSDYLLLLSDQPATAAPDEPPNYFSEEADEAARLIDAMQPARRAEALALLRVIAGFAGAPADDAAPITPVPGAVGGNLILGALAQKRSDTQGA